MRSLLLVDPRGSQRDVNNYQNIVGLNNKYFDALAKKINVQKLDYLKAALSAKFSVVEQGNVEVLRRSSPKRLIYNDPQDDFLGVGKSGRGQNMTGVVLEKFRMDRLGGESTELAGKASSSEARGRARGRVEFSSRAKWGKLRKQAAIYPKQILSSYFTNDKILSWIEYRLSDICRVMGLVCRYAEKMKGKKILIDKNLSNFVVSTLYKTCLPLSEAEIRDVPLDLDEKMKKYLPGFMFGEDAIKNVWRYLDNLAYNLELYSKSSKINIDRVLETIKDKLVDEGGSRSKCKGPYPDDKVKNCIFRAHISVCMNIKNFVSSNYGVPNLDLDSDLLEVAVSIIYIRDIKPEYQSIPLNKYDEKILKYLPSFDPRSVLEELNGVYQMYLKPLDKGVQTNISIRLQFFLNENPV
jgi:hypothetical protein